MLTLGRPGSSWSSLGRRVAWAACQALRPLAEFVSAGHFGPASRRAAFPSGAVGARADRLARRLPEGLEAAAFAPAASADLRARARRDGARAVDSCLTARPCRYRVICTRASSVSQTPDPAQLSLRPTESGGRLTDVITGCLRHRSGPRYRKRADDRTPGAKGVQSVPPCLARAGKEGSSQGHRALLALFVQHQSAFAAVRCCV